MNESRLLQHAHDQPRGHSEGTEHHRQVQQQHPLAAEGHVNIEVLPYQIQKILGHLKLQLSKLREQNPPVLILVGPDCVLRHPHQGVEDDDWVLQVDQGTAHNYCIKVQVIIITGNIDTAYLISRSSSTCPMVARCGHSAMNRDECCPGLLCNHSQEDTLHDVVTERVEQDLLHHQLLVKQHQVLHTSYLLSLAYNISKSLLT